MRSLIRWLAAPEIAQAQAAGFREGVRSTAASIREIAAKDTRPQARDLLRAVADGLDDAVGDHKT